MATKSNKAPKKVWWLKEFWAVGRVAGWGGQAGPGVKRSKKGRSEGGGLGGASCEEELEGQAGCRAVGRAVAKRS